MGFYLLPFKSVLYCYCRKEFSSHRKLTCGVPQGSMLGPLLFLLYVNDMPQAVSSELLLYVDGSCLLFMSKDSKTIGDQLKKDFNSLCEWFIDNKLSIHFGEEKTKLILFGTKQFLHKRKILNIRYGDTKMKQHTKATYVGCILDNDLSGESMVIKVLGLINGRLKFLYRKQKFLTYSLRRLLCKHWYSDTTTMHVLLGILLSINDFWKNPNITKQVYKVLLKTWQPSTYWCWWIQGNQLAAYKRKSLAMYLHKHF